MRRIGRSGTTPVRADELVVTRAQSDAHQRTNTIAVVRRVHVPLDVLRHQSYLAGQRHATRRSLGHRRDAPEHLDEARRVSRASHRHRLMRSCRIGIIPRGWLAFIFSLPPVVAAHAQAGGDDHAREEFEFSHPLVTESPSPDTKIRVDFLDRAAVDSTTPNGTARIEGEYAFRPWVSLALTVPFEWRSTDGGWSSGVAASELALKFAAFGLASHGLLLGGGLDVGLPTGSGVEEGPSSGVDLEPFADVAVKHGPVEVVAFGSYSASTAATGSEPKEREWSANFSSLYHVSGRAEALLELDGHGALSGADKGSGFTYLSPGAKLVPFANRSIMLGVSLRMPVSAAREFQRELLLTAMYHF